MVLYGRVEKMINKFMQKRNLNKDALISFIIFIIIICKDVLVSYIQIIPERSPLNRLVSWFIIFPLSIIGIILSTKIVKYYVYYWVEKRYFLIGRTFLLSLPTLLYISYFLIQFVINLKSVLSD